MSRRGRERYLARSAAGTIEHPCTAAAFPSRGSANATRNSKGAHGPTDLPRRRGAEGTRIDPGEVIVTTGGQQVIDLVCKALIDPGDVIVAEAPTYPGAVPTFGAYQARVAQIEMDADGMPIDALESKLDQLAAEGR